MKYIIEYCREIYNKQIYYMKVSVADENYDNIQMFSVAEVDDNNKKDSSEVFTIEASDLNSQIIFKNDVAVFIKKEKTKY